METLLSEQNRFSTIVDWDRVRYFTEQSWNFANYPINERWSFRACKPSPLLVYALDEFRHNTGHPVYISPKNWGVHSTTGYHSAGDTTANMVWAVDVFPTCDLMWAYHTALKSRFFVGIGVSPLWVYPKHNLYGGLHLDIRYFNTNKMIWYGAGKKYVTIRNTQQLQEMETLIFKNNKV